MIWSTGSESSVRVGEIGATPGSRGDSTLPLLPARMIARRHIVPPLKEGKGFGYAYWF